MPKIPSELQCEAWQLVRDALRNSPEPMSLSALHEQTRVPTTSLWNWCSDWVSQGWLTVIHRPHQGAVRGHARTLYELADTTDNAQIRAGESIHRCLVILCYMKRDSPEAVPKLKEVARLSLAAAAALEAS